MKRNPNPLLVASLLTLAAFSTRAAEVRYEIDPQHTYPSFEADHIGLDVLNKEALGAEMFDAAKFPKATYRGSFAKFVDGKPTTVQGELTLHGVTRRVELRSTQFKCIPHPRNKRDWCGADAEATIDRSQFGITAGKD